MTLTRDELKQKRLKAMGVVGNQMQATADMYDRVVEAGAIVAKARDAAETAHMGALNEHLADLKEMAEELGDFAQKVPMAGGAATAKPSTDAVALAAVSDALAVLNATQPNPRPNDWTDGDAYVGTR